MFDELTEADVDGRIVKFARKLGIIAIKLSSLAGRGEAGWPDRLFLKLRTMICPHCQKEIGYGKAVFIEMKRPGGKPTELQMNHMERLAEQGFPTYWTDNPEEGKSYIEKEFG